MLSDAHAPATAEAQTEAPDANVPPAPPKEKKVSKSKKSKKAKKVVAKKSAPKGQPRGEKTLEIKRLLERKSGVTRAEVLAATGWKAVSMQQMAKACGLKLRQEKEKGKKTSYFGS